MVIRYPFAASIVLTLLASGCERSPPPSAPKTVGPKTIQTGVASFYDRKFAGRKTASGERLKLDAMTAASRTLPLGSHVLVVNADTGKSAKVRINDRGPYVGDRVLDLTPKVAHHIGIDRKSGLAQVHVKVAQPETQAGT